jgi:hypothetical protein
VTKRPRPFLIRIYLEHAPSGGGVAHLPGLPGDSFRFHNRDEILLRAIEECTAYFRWLKAKNILAPLALAAPEEQPALSRATVVEEQAGREIWESGTAAVMFECDLGLVDDEWIRRHFIVIQTALEDLVSRALAVPQEEWDTPAEPGKRTLREQLIHVGNAVWWYCSRVDDTVPEPEGEDGDQTPDPPGRILRLTEWALHWCLGLDRDHREQIQRPTRFLSDDPEELWTLGKVLRRLAEHSIEHLRAMGGGP